MPVLAASRYHGAPSEVFFRQEEAMVYAREHGTRVWAFEVASPGGASRGKRRYVAAGYVPMLHLQHGPLGSLNMYEMVMYQADCPELTDPVDPYLDLEAKTADGLNPGVDLRAMGERLAALVLQKLDSDYPERAPWTSRNYFLDATRPGRKASKHVNMRLHDGSGTHCKFANVEALGGFMRQLLLRLFLRRDGTPNFSTFAEIEPEAPGRTNKGVDFLVWTRNRCFRTYMACKTGSMAVLRRDGFPDEDRPHNATQANTLLTFVRPGQSFDVLEARGEDPGTTKLNAACATDEGQRVGLAPARVHRDPKGDVAVLRPPSTRPSARPALDALQRRLAPLVLRALRDGKIDLAWTAQKGVVPHECVAFDLVDGICILTTRSGVCAIAGREHSSNHIYFLVDIRGRRYRQLCHNAVCSGSGYGKAPWERWDDPESVGYGACTAAQGAVARTLERHTVTLARVRALVP